ncbi:HAD family hydrolase [Tautonia sociabilis]|uniref:HAD-IB family hydrolase n=1 Tax=Tautonia sociabilis TaxID=2080755 RepID=A0A432MQV8_9BACT|nr:HAD-IB family hydrolase [Tautonia sociabilis]RUL89639.1 HAD-IB family hydrolase [Tautonia sociabilis]
MTWPNFDEPPSVAFLDVDGTLLAETTSYLYAKLLRRRGMIDQSILLRAALHGFRHKFGRLDYGRLLEYGFRLIRDIPLVELERAAYENFKDHVRPRLYEGVVDHLNRLRAGGTPLVLVSSSPAAVISPLGIYLGCSDLITTPIRVEDGRIAGLGPGPPCYGEGKLYWASRWAEERGIAMDAAVAYADNWSDRALLERVGRAVVVGPGRRLRKLAMLRGWTIVTPRSPRIGRRASPGE